MRLRRILKIYSGLPRSIYILFIVRIVNTMGNFVYPFLTLFLTERLGLTMKEAGTYFMIVAPAQALGTLIGGKLTDILGRLHMYIVLQFMVVCCLIPCGLVGNSMWVVWLLSLSNFFSGAAMPANSAMVNDLTNKDNRKQAFSLLYLGVNIGFTIGPTIAGFLFRNYTRWIFWGNAITIVCSLILLSLFVKETLPDKEEVLNSFDIKDDESAEEGNVLQVLMRRPVLMFFLIGKTIFAIIYSSIGFVIPMQFTKVFGIDAGPKNFGIFMSFTALIVILFTVPLTDITINKKAITNLCIAGVFYAFGFGMLGFIKSFILFLFAGFLFTIGEILDVTNSGVYVANHCPITHRGRFNSLITLIACIGTVVGPYIFGWLIELFDVRIFWVICFVVCILCVFFLLWVRYYEDKIKAIEASA